MLTIALFPFHVYLSILVYYDEFYILIYDLGFFDVWIPLIQVPVWKGYAVKKK